MNLANLAAHTVNAPSSESIHMASVNDHSVTERLLGNESRSSEEHSASEGDELEHVRLPGHSNGQNGRPGTYQESIKSVLLTWNQVKDIVAETAPTLLFTTIGLLFTGELLDHVSHWKAMTHVDELIIIIPVILNLKGNLEMNLSARLGTAANMGALDDRQNRRDIVLGNLALLQVQATIVSFVAAILSFGLGLIAPRAGSAAVDALADTAAAMFMHARTPKRPKIPKGHLKSGFNEFIMVASTGTASACLSGLILGSFMCSLVILCRRFNVDPDNIAPPVASCLGDLITLCLLGLVSAVLINFIKTPFPFILIVILVCSACYCAYLTRKNRHVRDLLWQGWSPLFGAMAISTASGLILDLFVSRYSGFALLAIVISGLPGAVGSVFVSRLSTMLHAEAASALPSSIKDTLKSANPSLRTVMITLFLITIPVEIIFLSMLRGVGWLTLPFAFIAASVLFFCAAVLASLYIAQFLTNWLWSKGRDPDLYALPIHSSVVDLLGQTLLVICFEIVSLLGLKVQPGAS